MPDETGTPGGKPDSQMLERKLATILSADVAEYSRLMGEDEEGTLRAFRGHKAVFESLVSMHRGRIFNTAGDAILAEFASAVEAVRCATDIQAALRTRNDQLAPNRQVRFRIGINLGDVMVQGQDLMGDGVNVAARIQTAAEPGGVCISGSVHDQIRNKLSLSFHPLGERSYKNIQTPVRTFVVSEPEAESDEVLPAAKVAPVAAAPVSNSGLKWVAVAVVLFAIGGGYWAYAAHQRSGEAAATAAAPTPPVAAPGASPPAASPNPAPQTADPAQSMMMMAAKPPATHPSSPAPASPSPGTLAASTAGTTAVATAAKSAAKSGSGAFDGTYAGPVCFGKTMLEPDRCFRAEATITGNKIKGEWLTGPHSGITMYLNGEVSSSGALKIEMHSEKSGGARVSTIELTGTVQGSALAANGAFLRGRSASIDWQRISRGN